METLKRLELLDAEECEQACRQVDKLEPHWLQRLPGLPYYTLGAASYLDAARDQGLYKRRAAKYNPLLAAELGWLHERVRLALASHTGSDFVQAPEAAWPGFHIFGFHRKFRQPMASIHFDRQHEDVPWRKVHELDVSERLTFTLPIRLPRSGAGLTIWDIHWEDCRQDGLVYPEILAQSRPSTHVPYSEGVLMVHSGNTLHQIAAVPDMQPGDRRITLQGHALKCNGIFQMYW
ncbi:MAG: hypothetical protein GY701_18235 [Sulfitobacter sp.]|nr:hypothetical protein [Sulfitobacter sp.]